MLELLSVYRNAFCPTGFRGARQHFVFRSDLGSPLLDEIPPPTRVALRLKFGQLDPVGSERAKILPKFTLAGDDAVGIEEVQADGPDDPFRLTSDGPPSKCPDCRFLRWHGWPRRTPSPAEFRSA